MKRRLINCALIFLTFAFLGALFEFICTSLANGNVIFYSKSLYLLFGLKIPFLPIYGFSGILLVMIGNFLDSYKVNFFARGLISGLLISLFELLSGFVVPILFNKRLWDYSAHFFNLFGIISLQVSIMWIISAYIFSAVYLYFKKNKKLKKFIKIL